LIESAHERLSAQVRRSPGAAQGNVALKVLPLCLNRALFALHR
jgi:hypothetical protein